jgi:hypothetical protein
MSGHTPTPYVVRNTGRPGVWKKLDSGWVKIASVEAPDSIPALASQGRQANAEFIVRATNNHEELVAVLREYEQWEANLIMDNGAWEMGQHMGHCLPLIPQHLWDRLVEIQGMRNAAIAKATGEEQA